MVMTHIPRVDSGEYFMREHVLEARWENIAFLEQHGVTEVDKIAKRLGIKKKSLEKMLKRKAEKEATC